MSAVYSDELEIHEYWMMSYFDYSLTLHFPLKDAHQIFVHPTLATDNYGRVLNTILP